MTSNSEQKPNKHKSASDRVTASGDALETPSEGALSGEVLAGDTPLEEAPTEEAHRERGSSSRHRRSHRHHRRSKSSRQLAKVSRTTRNLKIALTAAIMVLTSVVVVGKQYQNQLSAENRKLQKTIEKQRQRLKKSDTLNKKLLGDMDALVESRLPGLRKMEFDVVIPISERYIKNLIFVVSKDGQQTTYEYRLVFFNADSTPVIARTTLHLFSDRGIEIGRSNVTESGQASDGLGRSLSPGEIRSYSGSIQVTKNIIPRYFLLDIE